MSARGGICRWIKWTALGFAFALAILPESAWATTPVFIPQSFGASGSNLTISCNTIANGEIISCASPGNFTVGEGIKIDSGGPPVTVSSPAAPSVTPTCVGYQCVTYGSTTYSYAIAAVDGNGGLSAVGPATTINNGVSPLHGGGSTQSYNSLSWTAVPGAIGYLVYQSTGSGALTLLDISQGSYNGYNDYGRPYIQGAIFPSAPPANPLPGDLYGSITAIKGSNFTVSEPVGTTAAATVEHDDSAAFQAMVAALPSSASRITIPAGEYNLSICIQGAGYPYLLSFAGKNNVIIAGANNRTQLYFKQCKPYYFEGFGYGISTEPYISSGSLYDATAYEEQTVYPMTAATIGATQVTVSNPSDAANFAPGDFIYIRTGQTDPSGNQQPDAELNSVAAANPSTGVITLLWALEKNYQTECSPLPSTVANCSSGGSEWPMGVSNVTAATTQNFLMADVAIYADVAPIVFDVNQLNGFTMYNITAKVGNLVTIGDTRHVSIYDNTVTDWDGSSEAIGAKGVSDVTFYDNNWTALTNLILQASEGTTNLLVNNNAFTTSGAPSFPTYNDVLALRTVCHTVSITGNSFVNHNGDSVARLDPGCDGAIQLLSNIFQSNLADSVYAAWVAPLSPTITGNVIQGNLEPIVNANNVPIQQ
ncbi:MAG TPA: hypothetical protein VMU41_08525 [Candidatus Binataceae bacterium]|nr:hypothetical protein [Candidatus Binataceae bacterium]